ncbi:MAG: hypothetical protein EB084_22370 [Proteobacteria bacterium]|nr:hypothetical protein [Pseudomonadota bacterium]
MSERSAEARRLCVAAGLFLVAAVAWTWPLARHLDAQVLGYAGFENTEQTLWLYAEWKAYVAAAARDILGAHPWQPSRWLELAWTVLSFSAKISMANGIDFALTWPLERLFGFPAYYNVKCMLVMATNATAAYVLARALGARPWAAWVAGEIFAFNPFTFYQLETGRVIETILFPMPLYALFLWKAWHDDDRGGLWAVGAGLCCGLATLLYWFNGHFLMAYTALFLVYHLAVAPTRASVSALGRLLVVPLVALAMVMPAATPYCTLMARGERIPGEVREDPGTSPIERERYLRQLLNWSCDVDYGWRTPARHEEEGQRFDPPWQLPSINTFDGVLTLAGLLALFFVPAGRRFWVVAFGFLYLLPLGPMLKSQGVRLEVLGHYISLPYVWMANHLPLFDRLFFPTQCIGLWAMSVGVVVGLALSRVAERRLGVACALGVAVVAGSALNMTVRSQVPLPVTPVVVPATYRAPVEAGKVDGFIYLPVNLKYWAGDASFNREFYVEPDLKHIDFHIAMHGRKSLWGRNQYLAGKDAWMFQPETALANSFLHWLIGIDQRDDAFTVLDLRQVREAGLRYLVVSERLCSHTPSQGDYLNDFEKGAARFDEICKRLTERCGKPVEAFSETTWEKFMQASTVAPRAYRMAIFDLEGVAPQAAVGSRRL